MNGARGKRTTPRSSRIRSVSSLGQFVRSRQRLPPTRGREAGDPDLVPELFMLDPRYLPTRGGGCRVVQTGGKCEMEAVIG